MGADRLRPAAPSHCASAHVIGAGLAGLAAAVRLTDADIPVTVWDGAPQAGGRARSFYDEGLGVDIDNGTHLMFSGNRATRHFIDLIGAQDACHVAPRAAFPFMDLRRGTRWTVEINAGSLPWWLAVPSRRPPGVGALTLLTDMGRLRGAKAHQTVADVLDKYSVAFERFWRPLTVAVLNALPEQGSARLLSAVVTETLGAGGRAVRPLMATRGLSDLFAVPAVRAVLDRGGAVNLGARVRGLERSSDVVEMFHVEQAGRLETVPIGPQERVVLAVPPTAAVGLVPGLVVPEGYNAILNVHYRLTEGSRESSPAMTGLIGGAAEWVACRGSVASATVSAANDWMDRDAEDIAAHLWPDVRAALGLATAEPPRARVIKERRATFAATPGNETRRPGPRTTAANLFLAGDWTATGLPATIEGAVRSGFAAADAIIAGRPGQG